MNVLFSSKYGIIHLKEACINKEKKNREEE